MLQRTCGLKLKAHAGHDHHHAAVCMPNHACTHSDKFLQDNQASTGAISYGNTKMRTHAGGPKLARTPPSKKMHSASAVAQDSPALQPGQEPSPDPFVGSFNLARSPLGGSAARQVLLLGFHDSSA